MTLVDLCKHQMARGSCGLWRAEARGGALECIGCCLHVSALIARGETVNLDSTVGVQFRQQGCLHYGSDNAVIGQHSFNDREPRFGYRAVMLLCIILHLE